MSRWVPIGGFVRRERSRFRLDLSVLSTVELKLPLNAEMEPKQLQLWVILAASTFVGHLGSSGFSASHCRISSSRCGLEVLLRCSIQVLGVLTSTKLHNLPVSQGWMECCHLYPVLKSPPAYVTLFYTIGCFPLVVVSHSSVRPPILTRLTWTLRFQSQVFISILYF